MSDYTTTDDVRHEYVMSFRVEYQQEARAEFDRWLAEHDAALIEKLADEWHADNTGTSPRAYNWLREKARQRREEQS